MSVPELKQAIRDDHKAVRHEEFLGCVMAKADAELLDLYLDSKRNGSVRLWSGAYPKSPSLIRKLLARGLDPNSPDWLGRTFLHFCAAKGDQSIAEVFLKAGADINARDLESKGTPLANAVRVWCWETNTALAERRREMVEFLLQHGAATSLPGDEPWAKPLTCATRCGRSDIVELLKQHGAT